MIIVSYDIHDDKLRANFSKFLKKFGYRLQYSVYEVRNSDRILNKIKLRIEHEFSKKFSQRDSVLIFLLSNTCEIVKYGYAKNDDSDLIVL